jgi:site-specific recombinase XerD
VQIRVEAETSKVGKDRTAIGMRGDFFKRIKSYSKHTHKMDYVFADVDTGQPVARKLLYKIGNLIMKESGLADSPNDYSYYCLRHTFATYRLQFGKVDIRTLAKVMGCSVRFIEQHYDSAKVENMMDYITRDVERDDAFSDVILS